MACFGPHAINSIWTLSSARTKSPSYSVMYSRFYIMAEVIIKSSRSSSEVCIIEREEIIPRSLILLNTRIIISDESLIRMRRRMVLQATRHVLQSIQAVSCCSNAYKPPVKGFVNFLANRFYGITYGLY